MITTSRRAWPTIATEASRTASLVSTSIGSWDRPSSKPEKSG